MKTIIDFEKDNLYDFFDDMDLNQTTDFIEKYAKSEEEKILFYKILEKCIQIKLEKMLTEKNKMLKG